MSPQAIELAVQAITERNRLQRLVSALQKRLTKLENQTERAWQQGNLERVNIFQREITQCEGELILARQALKEKAATVEDIKAEMRDEEERIRRMAERALHERRLWQRSLTPHFLPAFTNNTGSNRMDFFAMDFFAWAALTLLVLALFLFLWLRMAT